MWPQSKGLLAFKMVLVDQDMLYSMVIFTKNDFVKIDFTEKKLPIALSSYKFNAIRFFPVKSLFHKIYFTKKIYREIDIFLISGDTSNYDWDSGYTCHQLGSGSICVQLGQPYAIESMKYAYSKQSIFFS